MGSGKDSSGQQVTWAHFAAAFSAPRRSESCTRSKADATMSRRHLNRQLMPEVRPHPEVEANDLPRRRLVLDSPYERSGRHPRRDSACAQRAAHQTIRDRGQIDQGRGFLSAEICWQGKCIDRPQTCMVRWRDQVAGMVGRDTPAIYDVVFCQIAACCVHSATAGARL